MRPRTWAYPLCAALLVSGCGGATPANGIFDLNYFEDQPAAEIAASVRDLCGGRRGKLIEGPGPGPQPGMLTATYDCGE